MRLDVKDGKRTITLTVAEKRVFAKAYQQLTTLVDIGEGDARPAMDGLHDLEWMWDDDAEKA